MPFISIWDIPLSFFIYIHNIIMIWFQGRYGLTGLLETIKSGICTVRFRENCPAHIQVLIGLVRDHVDKAVKKHLAGIPRSGTILLIIFHTLFKFTGNVYGSNLIYGHLITSKFCTCHDSYAALTCVKICDPFGGHCENFVEFEARLKNILWDGPQDVIQ